MKKIKVFIVAFLVFSIIYIGLSYILLDGKILYSTSFNESNIVESKKKGIFISDNLEIEVQGDTLKKMITDFEIWSNKRFVIKYFGILFHWTFHENNWRYLNIKIKENNTINPFTICVKKNNHNYPEQCCNRIPTFSNDTVIVNLITCKEQTELGNIKVVIK